MNQRTNALPSEYAFIQKSRPADSNPVAFIGPQHFYQLAFFRRPSKTYVAQQQYRPIKMPKACFYTLDFSAI